MPKHLAQGSSEPALQPGKLRLYGMRFCPYDQRVHLVMLAKNVLHDNVYINLQDKPSWYLEKFPAGKVPGLIVDDGEMLNESLIIADYLDEKYPEPPLHSKDPLQKAKDRIVIENYSKVCGAFYKFVFTPNPVKDDFDIFLAELVPFDKELSGRGTQFFGGNVPGMVDYMIWPWCERIGAMKLLFGSDFQFPQAKFKHLAPWMAAMKEDKVVKEYYLAPEVHSSYLKSYVNKTPDYDMEI